MDDRFQRVAALAASQHSVNSADQLIDLGITTSYRSKWERSGLLCRLGKRSFAMAGSASTFGRALSAGLADLGGHGVVACRALARLYGLDDFAGAQPEFLLPRAHRMFTTDGLVCSTSRPLTKADIETVQGFTCLTAERLILESPLFGFTKAAAANCSTH